LLVLDVLRSSPREVVIAGELGERSAEALLACVRTTFRPQRVVALAAHGADATLVPLIAGKTPGAHGARAYVCEDFRCLAPVDTPDDLQALLTAAVNAPEAAR
jgi:uncharacterized protein YyaL (SSP411 family)